MFMGQQPVGGGFIQLGPGAQAQASGFDTFGQGFPGGGFLQRGPQYAMGQQPVGGGFINPGPGARAQASAYDKFGQGFPGGGFLQAPQAPQQVPIVMGQVQYTSQVPGPGLKRRKSNFQNPMWPFRGPTGGQMWLQ